MSGYDLNRELLWACRGLQRLEGTASTEHFQACVATTRITKASLNPENIASGTQTSASLSALAFTLYLEWWHLFIVQGLTIYKSLSGQAINFESISSESRKTITSSTFLIDSADGARPASHTPSSPGFVTNHANVWSIFVRCRPPPYQTCITRRCRCWC